MRRLHCQQKCKKWPLRQNCTIDFNVLFSNYTILCTPFWEDFSFVCAVLGGFFVCLSIRSAVLGGFFFCLSVRSSFSSGRRKYYEVFVLSKLSYICTIVSHV